MSHILNHNFHKLKTYIDKTDYWDFYLDLLDCGKVGYQRIGEDAPLYDKCLISYIDSENDECTEYADEWIVSTTGYSWPCAYVAEDEANSALTHIGYVGTDNGLPQLSKDDSDERKIEVVTASKYEFASGDTRLKLHNVSGFGKYDFKDKAYVSGGTIILDGGFYQGFFATKDDQYKVLPVLHGGDAWNLEFTIKPKGDAEFQEGTVNASHPENAGMFFYIGTRAENKFAHLYNGTYSGASSVIEKMAIDESPLDENGGTHFVTDNKFLMFDRTRDGIRISNYEEGDSVEYYTHSKQWKDNPFLLFNRTKSGCTIANAETCAYQDSSGASYHYNVERDTYDNALAFRVREDGAIGYKYLTLNCELSGDSKVECIEAFSKPGIVTADKWNVVNVLIESTDTTMFLKFYVNGYLKFVSRELRKLNLRRLDESDEKQEGVPYNISLGGGTLGLDDMYLFGYDATEAYKLQESFCGTFIGEMKTFKFYNCPMSFCAIRQNYNHEMFRKQLINT